MAGQFSYGYLKAAVNAHLDLEEEEVAAMNINTRFHIFANEAIQNICHSKPKALYFEFQALSEFIPLVYDNGVLRVATTAEQNWAEYGLTEPAFASDDETAAWYNTQNIYLVNQVITMPEDFLAFLVKKPFVWTTYLTSKETATKQYLTYFSDTEIVVHYAANYLVPYSATWMTFAQTQDDKDIIPMPGDLALTIPIYVASVFLQQRDLNLAKAKRQEFEIALSRCKSTNFLENISVTSTFK